MYKGIVKDALFYLGELMASPLRFRHKDTKAERNTKWELLLPRMQEWRNAQISTNP